MTVTTNFSIFLAIYLFHQSMYLCRPSVCHNSVSDLLQPLRLALLAGRAVCKLLLCIALVNKLKEKKKDWSSVAQF